ncbi:MAG: lactate utilization protein [Christensenellales bacterium]|jgi:hypothetical protein
MPRATWSKIEKNLVARGFKTRRFETAEETREALLQALEGKKSVGLGGSMTIGGMNLTADLEKMGIAWHSHTAVPAHLRDEAIHSALFSDVYLCSANAVTIDGQVWNVDNRGNRTAATIMPFCKLIMIIGENKIVQRGRSPRERIANDAAPPNCARLGRNTPCTVTGKCSDCNSPERICNISVCMERPPKAKDMELWLVDEKMGY